MNFFCFMKEFFKKVVLEGGGVEPQTPLALIPFASVFFEKVDLGGCDHIYIYIYIDIEIEGERESE